MDAGAILLLWIVLYLVQQGSETLLTLLNLRHGARHPRPPAELEEVLDPATVARMRDYQLARSRLGLVRRALLVAVTLAVVAGGALGALDRALAVWLAAHGIASPLLAGAAFVVLLAVASMLLTLGLRLYGQFVIEARFGFNRMTVATFFLDQLKSLLLTLVLGVPLLLGLFWFMAETGDALVDLGVLLSWPRSNCWSTTCTSRSSRRCSTSSSRSPRARSKQRLVALAERLRFRVKSCAGDGRQPALAAQQRLLRRLRRRQAHRAVRHPARTRSTSRRWRRCSRTRSATRNGATSSSTSP